MIKFVSVITDSRSPKGVQTVWAGEAKSRLEITRLGSTSAVTLVEKGLTEGYTSEPISPYIISFQLQPCPEVGKQPAGNDYQLLMKVDAIPLSAAGPSGVPIIDNRAFVRGEVTAIAKLESVYPWRVELRVMSIENGGVFPNLLAGKEGQTISLRTDQDVSLLEIGKVITASVSLSGDVEHETFLFASNIPN